ncbi:hypothetical protein FRX31_028270 [Thalictrum thalictroides]|uniref:Uncharacterized protein n=1 Tax=Thalictrum thalictroides TaxID=46969 RepID=A0A7J6VBV5_THATH|nr:hypothetical protein FRX31_028270 [Thalictrum thalictroides]
MVEKGPSFGTIVVQFTDPQSSLLNGEVRNSPGFKQVALVSSSQQIVPYTLYSFGERGLLQQDSKDTLK